MKLGKLVGAAVALALCAGSATAATIGVFGDYSSSRDQLAAELVAQGHTVDNNVALPADLSSYDTLWHVGAFTPLSAAVQAQLSGFLALGKGIYLTGERPCCDALNNTIQSLINSNLAAGSVQIGSLGDINGPYSYNPSALGNIGSGISGWSPNAPGGMSGVFGDNVLISSDSNGVVVGAAWNDDDFVNGGRVVAFMDVNWLQGIDDAEKDVIAATQEFLFDGFVGPNPDEDPVSDDPEPVEPGPNVVPLPAAGWLLLGGFGALAGLRRRQKTA